MVTKEHNEEKERPGRKKRLTELAVGVGGAIVCYSLAALIVSNSQPEYREFVPTDGLWGYHLLESERGVGVQTKYGFNFSTTFDEDGDLKADYTIRGMAASVRLAGVTKGKPTLEEVAIFDEVVAKSKRFGGGE